MNYISRALALRVPGTFVRFRKFYHNSPHVSNIGYGIVKTLRDEQSICHLVQKTIIPFNVVKPKAAILDMPCTTSMGKLDYSLPEKIDLEPDKLIIDPSKREEKKAHRMLRIRRRKMLKHKRVKRNRKLKFLYAKIRHERRMRKELWFRQEIASKLKEAQKFNAEEYVAAKLEIFRKEILPTRLHGKRMPAFVIEEHIAKRKLKMKYIGEVQERRKMVLEERGTLDVDIKS